MRVVWTVILAVLTLLAVSSGVAKVILIQQEVVFFSKFGFSNPILIVYGALQLIGGVLLPFEKTRFIGSAIIAATFLISLVLLMLDGNVPLSVITAVATMLLGFVMVRSRKLEAPES